MVNVGEAAAARDLLEGQIRAYEEILGVLDAEMKEISVRRHSEALAEDAGESLLRKPRSRGHLGHGDRLGDVRGQVVRDPFQGVRMPARRRVVAVELLEETQDDSRCQVLRLEVSEERRCCQIPIILSIASRRTVGCDGWSFTGRSTPRTSRNEVARAADALRGRCRRVASRMSHRGKGCRRCRGGRTA